MSEAALAPFLLGAVVALAIAALFVLAELSARWWLRWKGEYFVWAPGRRIRMELDREVLPFLEPVVRFEINAAGERGDAVPKDMSRTARVLVGGGSAAECWYIDQHSAWPFVIQRILNQPEHRARLDVERVHVGNIARSLVDCRQLNLMFERVLPRYERIDVIVLLVGASDVIHWLQKGTPAVLEDDPIAVPDVFDEHPEGPFGWTVRTLALRRIASRWHRRLTRPVEVRLRSGARLGEARAMRARARVILDETPDPTPMLEYFEKHFRALVARARAKAQRVIVVRQPWFEKEHTPEEEARMWIFGQGLPFRGERTTYYSHRTVWELMRRIDERCRRVVADHGVEEVDLMPVLERSLGVYYDDMHHTPRGNEQVARVVAAAILRQPLHARDGAGPRVQNVEAGSPSSP